MRPVARSIGLGVTLLALAACNSLGPDYARPALIENDIGAPDIAFSTPAPPSPRALAAGPWWSGFGDPVLNDLVPRALKDNPDILQAQSLVRQAKADAVQVRSDGLPSLDGSTSVTGDSRRAWTDGPGRGSGTGPDGNGQPEVATDAGLEARYEVDLFGAQDRREQASAARIREAEADLTQTQSDVSAEVVTTYLTLRGTQTRLALARDSLALQRQTRDLVQGRVTAGLAPELDLTRARAAVQGLEADLILLESAIRRIEVEISVLLGQPPGQVAGLLASGPGVLPRMDFAPEV
ncbi:MAG: TolC family protein, partial [Rhodospirillaceae bacterium]